MMTVHNIALLQTGIKGNVNSLLPMNTIWCHQSFYYCESFSLITYTVWWTW